MQKQILEVNLDGRDEPVRTAVDGRDIRRWEAETGLSFITEPLSYTALTKLAAYSAVRSGQFKGTFQEFMDDAVDVRQVEEESVRPTKKARGGGSR